MKYSNLAHVPWAVGIQLAGVALFWLCGYFAAPAFWICGLGGILPMFARDEAKEEYQYIQAHGGLRANMPDLIELKFWQWTRHDLWETVWMAAAVVAVSIVATFALFGAHHG